MSEVDTKPMGTSFTYSFGSCLSAKINIVASSPAVTNNVSAGFIDTHLMGFSWGLIICAIINIVLAWH